MQDYHNKILNILKILNKRRAIKINLETLIMTGEIQENIKRRAEFEACSAQYNMLMLREAQNPRLIR